MTTAASPAKAGQDQGVRINDLVLEVATANGTGSQSANNVLVRSLFHMGIPVGAKNLFPSNIQGLPTWFTIRANKDGWTARRTDPDLMVCMNPDSVITDLSKLKPGAVVVLRHDLEGFVKRDDLTIIPVPFTDLVVPVCSVARLRKLVMNMLYVGVLAHLLQMDMDVVHESIDTQFANKPKAAETNREAVDAAHKWAKENLDPLPHLRVATMDATRDKILVDGNTASALGAIWGGVTVVSWYPITPSSSLPEAAIRYLGDLRHDPETGKATYAVIQAEDELAAIALVVGAGWAGARAMTATSGPGISLMAEQAGLLYFAEIPAVIVDVQRMGPSTGLPTRTCQNDIAKAYFLSHGDCKHPLLIPGTIQECFDFTCEAFNFAEHLQTLVMVMLDLDIGMNLWIGDPFQQPEKPIARGKVLSAEDLERLGGFKRYADVDGDGIPYRTLPGTNHPGAAYFTRGTGHTPAATYSESPDEWQANIDRLARKFETARGLLPEPVVRGASKPATAGVIAYGSSDPAVLEALSALEAEGMALDYMRVRALPFHAQVREFVESHEWVYWVEQNRDAQMIGIARAEWPELATRIRPVLHYNGMALDAVSIAKAIRTAQSAS